MRQQFNSPFGRTNRGRLISGVQCSELRFSRHNQGSDRIETAFTHNVIFESSAYQICDIINPMETLVDIGFILLGAALGVGSSGTFWWLQAHYWVPNIKFSKEIAEYVLDNGDSFFQCAFENVGKREIIDLEIQVRVGIKGYRRATGWAYHTVSSNASRVPQLGQSKGRRVRVFDTREPIDFLDAPSKSLRTKMESCASLREVLSLGEDAAVRVHVFGYDAFSGARKHFKSPEYRKHDIRKGTFRGLNVVKNKTL